MRVWRWIYVGALALCLVVGHGVWNPLNQLNATNSLVPRFVVDRFWPKTLPVIRIRVGRDSQFFCF